ncbi:c3 (predicted), partial [Pycnogonum litorale]
KTTELRITISTRLEIMEMLLLLGTILLFFNTAGAQKDYFVVAPNMFRFGVDETVTVSMHDIQGTADVEIYLQDAPGRGFTFSKRVLKVQNDKPVTTTVRVNPSDIPDVIVNDPRAKIYVYLVAICKSRQLSFTKEALILVSPHNGYVFIQTDKPIYTPLQEVRIRIIPLNQDLTLMTSPFRVQIVNPQNITVKRFEYKRGNENGIITEIYKFPRYTLEGIWGVSVEHGYEMSTTTYVPFEVKKYVLPTFDVKIKLNEGTIMESKADIEGTVTARYVYDKPVKGALRLRYGVKTSTGDVSYIPDEKKVEVKTINGRTSFKIPLKLVAQKFKGFPEGHKFHVEATVVEGVSGKEFMVVDESTYFQKSPYLINFKKTVSNFKIGLIVYVQAQVTYSTKTPAVGVDVVFTAITADGTKLNIPNNKRRTDKQGHVQVKLSVPNTSKLTINAVTQDNGLQKDQQGIGKFVMTPYNPGKQAYLGIKPLPASVKLQRGQQFDGTVIIQPWKEINRVVFRVIGRGKVLAAGKTATKKGKNTLEGTFTFKVTDEMIPSVRVVVLANYQNHLIADSLWMDVEDTCQHDTDTTITPNIPLLQPGRTGKVAVHAEKQSTVGIMAVDKAVYVLRNEGQLTSEKVYDTMEGYDVGCGAGGGRDSSNLLEKVGMIVLTSSTATKNEKRDYLRCNDLSRPKRQLEEQSSKWDSDPFIKACCEMGQKPSTFLATCEVRAGVLKVMLAEKYPSKLLCADAFLECCNAYTSVARSAGVEQLDFVTDLNAKESQTLTRTFFPESWLYKEIQMGGATDEEIVVTLPHSITTWVFQAVSVSKVRGICVADPKELVIHQNVFLDVNLPYSVVRNEEIELKVTIFNYLPQTLPVTVYMYGVKGICTGA